MIQNPYPETIIDETSGIEVRNEKHQIWEEGYKAGKWELIRKVNDDSARQD